MSLTAFKRKSAIQYGTNRSGKPPGGYWLPQGPFGKSGLKTLREAFTTVGPVGFSLNGGHRNKGYIGKSYAFSKNGTPFRGAQPCGTGGCCGTYSSPLPVFNVNNVIVLGTQSEYIKPSVLSTNGMLEKRYRWINNGQYPNNWVQPNYTGNQTDSSSQSLYIHQKKTANLCVIDVNDTEKYAGNIKEGGATLCYTTTARFQNYDIMASKGLYTKQLYQPITSGERTLYIQKPCANPTGAQKPFPYRVQTGTGIIPSGTSIRSVGNACNMTNTTIVPPEWYINSPSGIN